VSARVLLVEDNRDFVANLKEILSDIGHEVRGAESCASALKLARGWLDVALVDLRLPDGDGTTLAAQLKEENPDCEVVLLTGHASVESAAAAVRAGVWAYLIKPCATPDLLATLDKAVRHVKSQVEKRDLVRRAQIAEKLAAVGTLTAGLSHEIRNPLNAAALQLTVLERRLRKLDRAIQPQLLEPLTLVRDEIRRLEHILQDFLQFARPSPLNLSPLELGPVLEKVVAFMKTDAERRGVGLECHVLGNPVIMGDADQLRQVFMNLALNALDAAGPNGTVIITCEGAPPDPAVVHVDDSGPGIPLEMAERIFEPFFTTKAQGSGLGLPITNAIITQHGGRIEISRAPLGGARFSVVLPRS
jgi:two-component system, NtrC family, sensor histidine kinase HydH